MSAHITAVALLKAFGDKLGIPASAFGPSGQCQIGFDEIGLGLAYDERADAFLVESEIATLPQPEPAEFHARLLEFNSLAARLGGGHVGIDRSLKSIVFFNRRAAEGATLAALERLVQDSLAGVETWRTWLAAAQQNASDPQSAMGVSDWMVFRA